MGVIRFIARIIKFIKREKRVIAGDLGKDRLYGSSIKFPDMVSAAKGFSVAVNRMLDVNGWSDLKKPGNSDFKVFDEERTVRSSRIQKGDFIRIILPATIIENWVIVESVIENPNMVQFTVRPCGNPFENNATGETKHFFTSEATSTFMVIKKGTLVQAFEIGKNEKINNKDSQGGNRKVLNTLISESGWVFFQKVQWNLITNFWLYGD